MSTFDELYKTEILQAHPRDFLAYFTVNANAEGSRLSTFFVIPGIFYTLSQSTGHIVYGTDGYGKTAVCLMLKEFLDKNKDCLVIHFDHFWCFSQNGVTLDTWLGCIQQKLLDILQQELAKSKRRMQKFCASVKKQDFWAVCQYSRIHQNIVIEPANAEGILEHYRTSSTMDKFVILHHIVRASDFKNIYILVDGLEDNAHFRTTKDILDLIKHPLDHFGPLQNLGFTFKFFLPSVLEQPIQLGIGIPGGLTTRKLQWEPEQLRKMLANRLQNRPNPARPNTRLGTVQCFADLCVPDLGDVDGALVQTANGSPRRLMQLACAILEHHCQHDWSADRISAATIKAVLEAMRSDD